MKTFLIRLENNQLTVKDFTIITGIVMSLAAAAVITLKLTGAGIFTDIGL